MRSHQADPADLQPSQLYICDEKLADVERSLAEGGPVAPVPVKRLDGRLVLTDGHTRALALLRRGDQTIPVCWETDDLDWRAYRICVDWCLDARIRTVADLADRIVSSADYRVLWIDRCQAMHAERRRATKRRCARRRSMPLRSGTLASGRSVLLRDRVPEDVETYLRWMTSGEWRHFDAPWEGVRDSMDEETTKEFRERIAKLYEQELPEPRSFAFVATLDGIPLGWVNRYVRGSQKHEWCVGINLCEDDHLNRGLGTEALTLWVDYLFQHSDIHRLALETWSFNPRMARVAEKVGFQIEGRLREAQEWQGEWLDKLQYGLLRQERVLRKEEEATDE